MAQILRRQPCGKSGYRLSSRQIEVLQLVAETFSSKQIADQIGLTVKTIEKHRLTAMKKLGIHNAADVTRYVVSRGWIDLLGSRSPEGSRPKAMGQGPHS